MDYFQHIKIRNCCSLVIEIMNTNSVREVPKPAGPHHTYHQQKQYLSNLSSSKKMVLIQHFNMMNQQFEVLSHINQPKVLYQHFGIIELTISMLLVR